MHWATDASLLVALESLTSPLGPMVTDAVTSTSAFGEGLCSQQSWRSSSQWLAIT